MTNPDEILKAAQQAPEKDELAPHFAAVHALREKNYSWREIAEFLETHGVRAEHTKLFRMYTKQRSLSMNVPDALTYADGLRSLKISKDQRAMLGYHFMAHNRTVTYTELAHAAGASDHRVANSAYGKLGRALGETVEYPFPSVQSTGALFYSGALGIDAPRTERGEYRLMMHHELAKAIETLGWFQ